jgi:hypothetical protein
VRRDVCRGLHEAIRARAPADSSASGKPRPSPEPPPATGATLPLQGGGDSIEFYAGNAGTNALFIDNTTISDFDTITNAAAASGAVYLDNAVALVQGGGDSIEFYAGSGNAVFLENTAGGFDTVQGATGESGIVYLTNARANVLGGGDILDFAGDDSVQAKGGSELFEFSAALGESTISGFASSDTIRFSKSDFADYQALLPHIAQSGANTTITLNSTNVLTLTGVTATSLKRSEFQFV